MITIIQLFVTAFFLLAVISIYVKVSVILHLLKRFKFTQEGNGWYIYDTLTKNLIRNEDTQMIRFNTEKEAKEYIIKQLN